MEVLIVVVLFYVKTCGSIVFVVLFYVKTCGSIDCCCFVLCKNLWKY